MAWPGGDRWPGRAAFVLPSSVFHGLSTGATPSDSKAAVGRRWKTRCRVIGRTCGSRDLGPGVGDGPEQPVALGVDGPDGVQVAVRMGLGVEFLERDAGLEAFFGMGQGAQLVVGRLDVGGPVDAADAAVGALALGGEQAGPVVVEVRRQVLPSERVDERREALRDVVVAEEPAHDVGVLALDEGVVGGAPRTRLGEVPDVQLVEQRDHGVVDVLGAGASLRDALSAWKPTTTNGNRPSRPSSTGTRKRSEIATTAPTNSYCVTSSTTLIRYTPLAPSRSPW